MSGWVGGWVGGLVGGWVSGWVGGLTMITDDYGEDCINYILIQR